MTIFFHPDCLKYNQPGHPESPQRVSLTYAYLKEKGFDTFDGAKPRHLGRGLKAPLSINPEPVRPRSGLSPEQSRRTEQTSGFSPRCVEWVEFTKPVACNKEDILLVHSNKLLKEVEGGDFFEGDTPALPNIFHFACLSAGSAIQSGLCSLEKETAFSLMRPPGHHATKDNLGGFCYFNNIAIAVMKAKEKVDKIAIVDLDCHHGNGTQDIFLGRKDIIYISLHQSPLYPGTGLRSEKNCFNYPLPAQTSSQEYLKTLKRSLEGLEKFNPDLVAVSMGFDTYKLDPIAGFSLEKDTYSQIGKLLSDIGKPLFSVLEGGYNTSDLPECIYQYLTGLS